MDYNVNAEDSIGVTPLRGRTLGQHKGEMQDLLLTSGANYSEEDKKYLTILDEVFQKVVVMEDCLPGSSGAEPSGRRKRNVAGQAVKFHGKMWMN